MLGLLNSAQAGTVVAGQEVEKMYVKLNRSELKAEGTNEFELADETFDYHLNQKTGALQGRITNRLGTFAFEMPWLIEFEIEYLEYAARQLNKMKTALESMK